MKKILVAFALAAFASTASATIAGGHHDMTRAPYNGQMGTCQYCHAPHLWNASNIPVSAAEAPLWNRNNVTAPASYTPYIAAVVPGSRSLTCLSCHDGASGNNVGAVNNGAPETLAAIPAAVNVGTNLQNDHPVGVVLVPAVGSYQLPPVASGIVLATGNQVECSSCHEPHSNATFFLRATGAAICAACHLK